MAETRRRVVVVGHRGVFGSLLVQELSRDFEVGGDFEGAYAVACAAGPFQKLDRGMVREAVDAGAHWLDIADDAGWFFDLFDDPALDALAKQRDVAVIPGLSSLPAISGALVRKLGAKKVTITLEINNANRKGAAAMASAAQFNPPDGELHRRELGVEAETRVKFELPIAGPMLRLLGRLPMPARIRVTKLISRLPLRFGKPGGAVEVRGENGVVRAEARDQRFAILPLVYALHRLDGLNGCLSPTVFATGELLRFVTQ
jgi:hypothetical protein